MTIEKRGNAYRIRQMYKGQMYSVTVDHKPSQKEATILIADALKSAPKHKTSGTFFDCATVSIQAKTNTASPETIRGYYKMQRNMPEWFKNLNIYDIRTLDLKLMLNEYSENHAPHSVKNMLSFCSGVIHDYRPDFDARINIKKDKNSAGKYDGEEIEDDEVYVPTMEEVQAVLDAVKGTEFEIPYWLARYGLRRSEIVAFRPDRVEGDAIIVRSAKVYSYENKYVEKSTKTKMSRRTVPVSHYLIELIEKIDDKTSPVVKCDPNTLLSHLHMIQRELKINKFTLHGMRHFFATELLYLGVPMPTVQYLGGWTSDSTIKKHYLKIRERDNAELGRAAIEKLDAKMNEIKKDNS